MHVKYPQNGKMLKWEIFIFFRMFKRDLQKLQALLLRKTCLFENLHPARFHLK